MNNFKKLAEKFCESENISGEKIWLDSTGEHILIEDVLVKFNEFIFKKDSRAIENIKDKYAQESGFEDFYDYIKNSTTGEIDYHCSHVATVFANQKSIDKKVD